MNLYTQENIKRRQISTQNDERILLPSGIWEARRQRADIVKVVKFENIPVSYVHCMYVCVPKRQLCCWYSIYGVSDKCILCIAVLDREKNNQPISLLQGGFKHALWRCHFFGVPPKWEFIMPHFRQKTKRETLPAWEHDSRVKNLVSVV